VLESSDLVRPMKMALLVDGEFFLRRHRVCFAPDPTPKQVADDLFTMALAHASDDGGDGNSLYRIFFYDCEPLSKKAHRPKSKAAIDFSKTDTFRFRGALHQELVRVRKVALRLGRLQESQAAWRLKEGVLHELLNGKRAFVDLSDDDFHYDVKQKGVDMRIGLDIASLAFKRQVDKIVLVAGDADFVPAAKLARREGIDFVLDPMWQQIPADLMQHIDGLKSHCKKPEKT
jgi:uncharacterized LabA/DUF88 family protein